MTFTRRMRDRFRPLSEEEAGTQPSFEFPKTGEYPQDLLLHDDDWKVGNLLRHPGPGARAIGRFPVRTTIHDLSFMHDQPQELPQYPIPTPITSSTLYQSNNVERPSEPQV